MAFEDKDKAAVLRLAYIDLEQKQQAEVGDYTVTEILAAATAVYDWFTDPSTRSAVGALINTATSPTVITAATKKRIAARVLEIALAREEAQ